MYPAVAMAPNTQGNTPVRRAGAAGVGPGAWLTLAQPTCASARPLGHLRALWGWAGRREGGDAADLDLGPGSSQVQAAQTLPQLANNGAWAEALAADQGGSGNPGIPTSEPKPQPL